jgi:tripartite-type tricarboxylate transporter receptor subunit TctC
VQIGFDVMVTSLPHVRTGALRALAVAGSRRFEALPEVPTIAEALPGYEARTWAGVGAPKGTPAAVIERLDRDIGAVLAEPTIEARLADLGTVPMPLNAQEFADFIAAVNENGDTLRLCVAIPSAMGTPSLTLKSRYQSRLRIAPRGGS